MRPRYPVAFAVVLAWSALAALDCAANPPYIAVTVDRNEAGMGESVTLTSTVRGADKAVAPGYRVVPFVNGRRWGAIETSDATGKTTHHLPLPNPGPVEIRMLVEPPANLGERPQWIWGPPVPEDAMHYFQRVFTWDGPPESAVLDVVADDSAVVFLNGTELGTAQGWQNAARFENLGSALQTGENTLSIVAASRGGLGGLLVRLDTREDPNRALVASDGTWSYFDSAPYGWPIRAEDGGTRPVVLGDAEWSPWRPRMQDWRGLASRSFDIAGTPLPIDLEGTVVSLPIQVQVKRRLLQRPLGNPDQRVGVQFEPWFTPRNASWGASPAVPLTGLYWSWNSEVARQQMIWLIESGVDFLVVDWTNHLWGVERWEDRPEAANEIIHATTILLETLATLRDEGQPYPTVVLYGGLNNGPETTVAALNGALAWIHDTYIRNPRFEGLFEIHQDKPLFLVHNGAGPAWKDKTGAAQPDDSRFTLRHQSSMHEFSDHASHGFWSWMDASLQPPPKLHEGTVEGLTVSVGFFSRGGWTQEGAYGRRGGWTLVEGFKSAMTHRPRYLQVHQYQEFAGQWEGGGYGPGKDLFFDSYNVELSDDIEPVSLTARAYRGQGGWGFYYLNLLRALVDCYHQPEPQTTVLALDHPGYRQPVSGSELPLRWTWVGKAPTGFLLNINGTIHELDAGVVEFTADLTAIKEGPFDVTLTAVGTEARYPLSWTEASPPAEVLAPATVATTLLRRP